MTDLPHLYKVKSEGKEAENLIVRVDNLSDITVAPPKQFGGPGDEWSPEDLLMASIASCVILSFRAIARASKLEWSSIECESQGKLDKVERKVRFTNILINVSLSIPKNGNKEKAERLLMKAKEACLISNSLLCESHIEYEVTLGCE